jgi:hypothetical protein
MVLLFTKNDIDEVNNFRVGNVWQTQVLSWFETLEWTPTFEFTKVSFKHFVVIINLDID